MAVEAALDDGSAEAGGGPEDADVTGAAADELAAGAEAEPAVAACRRRIRHADTTEAEKPARATANDASTGERKNPLVEARPGGRMGRRSGVVI